MNLSKDFKPTTVSCADIVHVYFDFSKSLTSSLASSPTLSDDFNFIMSKKLIMKKYKCLRKRRFSHCDSILSTLAIPVAKRSRAECNFDFNHELQAKERGPLVLQKTEAGADLTFKNVLTHGSRRTAHSKLNESASEGTNGITRKLGESQGVKEKRRLVQQNGVFDQQSTVGQSLKAHNHHESLISSAAMANTASEFFTMNHKQKQSGTDDNPASFEKRLTRRMRGTKIPDLICEMSSVLDPESMVRGKPESHGAITLSNAFANHIIKNSKGHGRHAPSALVNTAITDES